MSLFSKQSKPSHNSRAVVTGAGSGIGRAFSLELAARGGEILCTDIDLDAAEQTVKLIKAAGGKAHALRCDVAQLGDVELMASKAELLLSTPVNLVINNAGIGTGGTPVGKVSMEDWHATVNVNLWGVIHGCHVFAPKLKAVGSGGMINVASTASFAAAPLMGPYNVTKAGVLALTETMAAEFSGTDLHITALCPTFVKTNIVANGRLAGDSKGIADKLLEFTGRSAESVVKNALAGYDRKQLYVLPQIEARTIWRGKRLLPGLYNQGTGLLQQLRNRTESTANPAEVLKAAPKKTA
jgi:NAD(P)-dependent dehydrogenase (short-subunit alcohol dehydrogenase family)